MPGSNLTHLNTFHVGSYIVQMNRDGEEELKRKKNNNNVTYANLVLIAPVLFSMSLSFSLSILLQLCYSNPVSGSFHKHGFGVYWSVFIEARIEWMSTIN